MLMYAIVSKAEDVVIVERFLFIISTFQCENLMDICFVLNVTQWRVKCGLPIRRLRNLRSVYEPHPRHMVQDRLGANVSNRVFHQSGTHYVD
jgi:hypothetical protein